MEIREVHTGNDGRDPFPVLVCRQRLPKDRTKVECKYFLFTLSLKNISQAIDNLEYHKQEAMQETLIHVSHKIKSAYKPSGPSGRSISRFLLYEATRIIFTPPWMGC